MILTEAPKDLGGRLLRNCARTTPELPIRLTSSRKLPQTNILSLVSCEALRQHTMWSGDLAPDDSDLRPTHDLVRAIHESDFLAEVESDKT